MNAPEELPPDPLANHDRNDPGSSHVEVVGPFQHTFVILNGFRVPHLTTYELPGGTMSLVVDSRLAYDVPLASFDAVVELVANAIAVERGYSHFPTGESEMSMEKAYPFGGQWHGITSVAAD